MNIPIVQGVAVDNQGGAKTSNAPPYSTNTPYNATDEGTFQDFSATGGGSNQRPNQQGFQDGLWAIAFIVHLVVMVVLISMNMGLSNDGGGSGYSGVAWLVGIGAVASTGISSASLGFMMKYATELVKSALIFSVGLSLLMALWMLMMQQLLMAGLGFAAFAVGVCYARAVWDRIPFAAANLNTALTAVRANLGLAIVAYTSMVIALVWTVVWFIGTSDALSGENAVIMFFLLLSYYWTHQVLQNTVHVTTAGTIGTWWFVPEEASSGFCSPAIMDSFRRATTTSFGSICFGSFVLAVVQALRTTQRMIRDNDECNIVACIIDCILGMIEAIIQYVNKWAYVYVGLYGFSYLEAGKNVIQLFEQKGWTVVITDDLADNVLTMVSMGIGLCTGLITMVVALADRNLLMVFTGDGGSPALPGFFIGFIVGFVFSSILMGVVGSAVNTVIVCYAESPAEFQANHPQLSAEMRAAWTNAYPTLNGL